MSIPIQNIYYLLCYAWNKLEESEIVDVNAIDSTELTDLFAKVLSNSCTKLLKQGLDRYYIENEGIVMGIKGKLNFSETFKQNILHLSKTICSFDEFDYDILHNQILKTTIRKLLRVKNIDSEIKDELHRVYKKLPPISEISIRNSLFKQVRLHRNNYHYDFILKVCQIINDNIFIDEASGKYKFRDFIREEKAMAGLFESFVRNFYKIETDYKVTSSAIDWKFDSDNLDDLNMLPKMFTDTTLQKESRKIIIDTKYYKEAFTTRFDKTKINSNNLYQLFAYLKNQEDGSEITLNCVGILLYPSIQFDFAYTFKYKDHKIKIISINLNQNWDKIHSDLLKIIE